MLIREPSAGGGAGAMSAPQERTAKQVCVGECICTYVFRILICNYTSVCPSMKLLYVPLSYFGMKMFINYVVNTFARASFTENTA